MHDVNWVALSIFVVLFAFITWLGFAAARWRKGDLDQLHEWGLGGRRFGTLITWFLVGGDLYTAYTFVAVPALAFGAGAVAFFAVPYTIVVYPLLFLVFPRLWQVCHKRGYITAGDFVRGRYGNRWLALAITVTGIVATMPYIALQLLGLQVVLGGLGVYGTGLAADLPLIIAFVILAAFTYSSGLRAPASIAIVKDILIYITAFVAVIVIPMQLGGFGKIFAAVPHEQGAAGDARGQHHGRLRRLRDARARLGAGVAAVSAFPHCDPLRQQQPCHPPQRGAPAGLFLHAGTARAGRLFRHRRGRIQAPGVRGRVQAVRQQLRDTGAVPAQLPVVVRGRGFRRDRIGALVPAAIMSIAAANLYTRNIHCEFINRNPSPKQEAQLAKWVSLVVKVGALVFILFVPTKFAIYLQLLGGIWIIQTLPTVVFGAYTRWFNDWALLVGWAVGTYAGTAMAISQDLKPAYPAEGRRLYPARLHGLLHAATESRDRRGADTGIQRAAREEGGRDGPERLPQPEAARAATDFSSCEAIIGQAVRLGNPRLSLAVPASVRTVRHRTSRACVAAHLRSR